MKKFLIASGIAALAFASVAGAQGYMFSTNLTVGSTGPDVVALQTWLLANGYVIPAVSSGAAAKGYFGSQTKTAVMKYQASKGIPNTGFVGPLTRAALNGGATMTSTQCPTGFTCTSTQTTMTCPVGFTCTPTAGTTVATGSTSGTPGVISTPGVVGTLAVSLWSTPSGIVAYKGQAYDIAAYKVQASASDMAIQNLTLDFDNRLWLYASTITIKDDSGAVVGSISGLNQSNFSELTVGSDYRVSIPVNGYVVRATQTKYLTVNVSFLPTSDRATGTLNVLQAQIRSVDGTGVTDTETSTGGARSFTYQGSGAGSIIVTTDSASPATGLVQLSTSAQTQNVVLGIFDIKSQNAPSTLRSLSVLIRTTGPANVSSLFSNIQIKVGGLTYSANNICTDNVSTGCVGTNSTSVKSTVVFNNMTVPLAADTYVPVTIMANLAVDTNNVLDGTVASTSLVAQGTVGATSNNPDIEDQSFNTLAVNSATFTANNQTFTGSSVVAGNLSTTYGGLNTNSTTGNTAQQFTYNFSLTAGNNPIYVSSNPFAAISTTSNPAGFTITSANFSDSDTSGDATGYFYLAPGQSKNFTAVYQAFASTSNAGTIQVNSINYGTTTTALASGNLTQSTIQNTLKAILFH